MNRCLLLLVTSACVWSAVDDVSSWQIGPFSRPTSEPVITPNRDSVFRNPIDGRTVHWEALHTFNPAAVVRNGKIYVLYRAEDDTGEMRIGLHTSRIGLAESEDGIHLRRLPQPVLYPDNDSEKEREWPGGCEDPRIVESEDGTYVLTYTQWNRRRTDAAIATSKDLIHWTKHGPALGAAGKYSSLSYKSAGIVTRMARGRLIAAKIGGKYWMYWGEREVRLASSTDLIHWQVVEDSSGQPVVVLARRSRRFDSSFPETGPPPLVTENGILVLYNGRNAAKDGDPSLDANSYTVGEALFAGDEPAKLVARSDHPVLQPRLAFEKSGQYAAGTTFGEGLVWFQNKWFLYYGCADSMVGVATAEQPSR